MIELTKSDTNNRHNLVKEISETYIHILSEVLHYATSDSSSFSGKVLVAISFNHVIPSKAIN